MKATIEPTEGNEHKIQVTIPPEDVDRAIAQAYKDISKQVNVKGFRKGRVPRNVIDVNVGTAQVRQHAAETLISETFPEAVEQLGIFPMSTPESAPMNVLVDGEEFEYYGGVELRPEVVLSSVDDIKVEVEPTVPEEREVDAQIEFLRDQHAALEVVDDRGIGDGDFVLLSFVGYIDEEPYEENEVDGLLYQLGQGDMPEQFDDALLGARAGDEVVAEFVIPDTSQEPEYVGKTAKFVIKVTEVKSKVLPDIDDEFAVTASGLESLDALKDDIRKHLAEAKEVGRKRAVECQAHAALAERIEDFEIPVDLVQARAREMYREFRESLQSRDASEADYMRATGLTLDQINEDINKQADQRIREEFALEALFRSQGLELGEDEVEEELKRMAVAYQMEPEKLKADLSGKFMLPVLRLQLIFKRATDWLMDHVEIVETQPGAAIAAAEETDPAAAKKTSKGSAGSAGTKSKAKKAADKAEKKKDEGEAEA